MYIGFIKLKSESYSLIEQPSVLLQTCQVCHRGLFWIASISAFYKSSDCVTSNVPVSLSKTVSFIER